MVSVLNKRSSNFELLRIISMLLIVFHHLIIHSNFDLVNNNASFINNIFSVVFQSGGKLGVVLFAMITGYFMITSKIKIKKIISLELQVLFYSITLFLIFNGFVYEKYEFWKFLIPNVSKIYWFFSSYFILYLLIPYINKLLLELNKKEYLRLLGLGFVFLILLPLLFTNRVINNNTIYLVYYYIIGAYIRLYGDKLTDRKIYFCGFCFFYSLIVIFSLLISFFTFKNCSLVDKIWMFSNIDSIFVFGSAICVFLFFKNLNIRYNKFINLMASMSFGIYLFHDHPLVRNLLFNEMFLTEKLILRNDFVIISILMVLFIYFIGCCIEIIRQWIWFFVK